MNTSIPRNTFHTALDTIRRTVPLTAQTPLFLEAWQGVLALSATDTVVGTTVRLETEVQEYGSVLIPFAKFAEYITHCGDSLLSLQTEETILTVRSGRAKATFPCYGDDGTYTQAVTSHAEGMIAAFTLDALLFRSIIEDVCFAAAKETTAAGREFFTCVLMKPKQHQANSLDIVASDGSFMAHRQLSIKHNISDQLLLPALPLKHFVATLKNSDAPVQCFVNARGNVAVLSCGDTECFVRLLNNRYVVFSDIYPPGYTFHAAFQTQELLDALERCAIYHDFRVVLDIHYNEIIVSSSSDIGTNSESVAAEVNTDEPLRVAMPIKSMMSALSHIGTEQTVISCFPSSARPALVFAPPTDRVRYPIMPLAK